MRHFLTLNSKNSVISKKKNWWQKSIYYYTYQVSLYILFFFRCTAFSYLEGDPELAYFAVYDGHGGTGVANYLKDHCHEFILDQPEYKEGNIEESVLKAFLQVRH